MRFIIPRSEWITENAVQCAYLAGMDGDPWTSRNRLEGNEVVIDRTVSESGNLYIPWTVEGSGELVLSTTSLMERETAYNLPVELARGVLNQLRNQSSNWELSGLQLSAPFSSKLQDATSRFIRAATIQDPVSAAEEAQQAIRNALQAADILTDDFSRQVFQMRGESSQDGGRLLVGDLGRAPLGEQEQEMFCSAFNSASVQFVWSDIEPNSGTFNWDQVDRQIQWCDERGMRLIGGPILQLDRSKIPDWLYLWEGDFENLSSYLYQFLTAVVERYRGKTHIWHIASRLNVGDALALSESDRLRLAVGALQAVRQTDPQTPTIMSFDQPWGEYLKNGKHDLSPLYFADALVRTDLGLAGIGLEFNLGYSSCGAMMRDPLEISNLIDRWSALNLPLLVSLTIPNDASDDALATHASRSQPDKSASWSDEKQKELVQRLVPFLLAKPAVHGVCWKQLSDDERHDYPSGGMLDRQRNPKPMYQSLVEFRKQASL